MIFPVLFKTRAQRQFAPVREFRRRVRLALEEKNLLPGDPYRVFNRSADAVALPGRKSAAEAAPAHDPTARKAPEGNPFSGE